MADLLKSDPQQLEGRLQKLLERQKELEREVESLQGRLNAGQAAGMLERARTVAGVKLLAEKVDSLDAKGMRELADQLRERLGSGVIVLGGESGGKANLLVAVTKDLTGRLSAGDLIRDLAAKVGGKGGGRPDLAQAGGSEPQKLGEALASAEELIAVRLG
jgi:alanyl-tRNA synthetase